MTKDEAMKLALEALNQATGMCAERTSTRKDIDEAITALRQALEQPKREWVGLTDEEAVTLVAYHNPLMNKVAIARAVEAKLREKNGF